MKNLSPAVSAKHAPVALNSRFIPATTPRNPVSMPAQLVKRTSFNLIKKPSADAIQQAIDAVMASDKLGFSNMTLLEAWQYFVELETDMAQRLYFRKWLTEKVTFVLDYFNINQVGNLNRAALIKGITLISLYNAAPVYRKHAHHKERYPVEDCIDAAGWDEKYSDIGPLQPLITVPVYEEKLAFIERDIIAPLLAKLHDAAYPDLSKYVRPKPTNCFEEMGHSMEWAAYNVWFADKTKAILNFFFYPFFTKAEAENFIEDVLKPSFPDEKFTISASAWIGCQEDRSLPYDKEYMAKMSENPYFHMWMLEVKRYKNSDKYQQILKAKQERIDAVMAEYKQQQGVH